MNIYGDVDPNTEYVTVDPTDKSLEGCRVLIVICTLQLGGAERQALLLASLLHRRFRAHVEILATVGSIGPVATLCDKWSIDWSIVSAPRIGIRSGLRGFVRELRMIRSFGRELARRRPDVVLPFMTMPNVYCGIAWRWSGARLCVWNQRNVECEPLPRWLRIPAVRLTPVFVSNTEAGAEYLTRHLGANPARTHVVRNGVALPAPQLCRAEWRNMHGIGAGDIVACMLANFHPRKDHATAVRAWRRVVDASSKRMVLVLAGRDDGTREELESLAAELGVRDRIIFLPAVEDVSSMIYACDLGILCSFDEGTPNAVLEFMAAKVPVIGSDLPGIRECLGEHASELVAPVGDDREIARLVLELAFGDERRQTVGALLAARIESEFSPDRLVADMASLIGFGQGLS